jgi:hypothetical protein
MAEKQLEHNEMLAVGVKDVVVITSSLFEGSCW